MGGGTAQPFSVQVESRDATDHRGCQGAGHRRPLKVQEGVAARLGGVGDAALQGVLGLKQRGRHEDAGARGTDGH
jgi:hypothetical protein